MCNHRWTQCMKLCDISTYCASAPPFCFHHEGVVSYLASHGSCHAHVQGHVPTCKLICTECLASKVLACK